jgi:hypothetical protein
LAVDVGLRMEVLLGLLGDLVDVGVLVCLRHFGCVCCWLMWIEFEKIEVKSLRRGFGYQKVIVLWRGKENEGKFRFCTLVLLVTSTMMKEWWTLMMSRRPHI